jgi:hypothetical protein
MVLHSFSGERDEEKNSCPFQPSVSHITYWDIPAPIDDIYFIEFLFLIRKFRSIKH